MKRILVALVLLASAAGCRVSGDLGISAAKKERPTVNVPERAAASNWIGDQGMGLASTPQ